MARPHPLLIEIAADRPIDAARVDVAVVESAVDHRMQGLLLAVVERAEGVDHEVAARLQAIDMANTVHRQKLNRVADHLHRTLEDAGIDHFFFKGIVEAHRTFESPNHRPFADIDLCLRPGESLSAAVGAIAPDFPDADLLDDLVTGGYTSVVSFFEDGQPIDIHTDAVRVGPRALDPDLWWKSTVEIDLPRIGTVRALDREASFVVFAVHQARDRFRYLIGAAEYRRRVLAGLDLDRVRLLAEAEGLWDQVSTAVQVMSKDLGIEPPLRGSSVRAKIWGRMWDDDVRLLGPGGRYRNSRRSQWLMPLLARGRGASSLWWIIRSAFPPDAHLRRKHPDATGPYLWRIVSTRLGHYKRRRRLARQTDPSD